MNAAFTVGDKGIPISGTLTDAGTPVDLTGATLELHILQPDGTVLTRTATTVDAGQGGWSYTWAGGDLSVEGHWKIEVQVTDGDVIQTFGPAGFMVRDQIA